MSIPQNNNVEICQPWYWQKSIAFNLVIIAQMKHLENFQGKWDHLNVNLLKAISTNDHTHEPLKTHL